MTQQPDPGHPPRPQPHPEADVGRLYGPPPLPPQPGGVPGPRPPAPPGSPGPQGTQGTPSIPPEQWTPPARKGVLGTLLDLNFDYMITAKLVKIVYALALVAFCLADLILAWWGLALLADGSAYGLALLVATPFVWLFQVLVTRLFLEFVINQFKISEYLRVIKDKS
jgi:hypothetical protein